MGNDIELLLTEIVGVLANIGTRCYNAGQDWKGNPVNYQEKAREILAKVKQHYPIMFGEEADLDGFMLRHGWTPPKEWKRLDRPGLRMQFARTLHKALRQFEVEGCPEAFDMRVHIDQFLKGYPDIEELEKRIRKQATDTIKGIEEMYEEDEANVIKEAKKQLIAHIEKNCKGYEDRTVGNLLGSTFWQDLQGLEG